MSDDNCSDNGLDTLENVGTVNTIEGVRIVDYTKKCQGLSRSGLMSVLLKVFFLDRDWLFRKFAWAVRAFLLHNNSRLGALKLVREKQLLANLLQHRR